MIEMPKREEQTNRNDQRNNETQANGPNEDTNQEEKLTKEMIERNKEWARNHRRKNKYTSS